eukprot:21010-Heterococcus_DN1.PRE.4
MEFEGTSDIPRAKNAIHITTDAREPITSVSFIPGSHQTLAAITTRVRFQSITHTTRAPRESLLIMLGCIHLLISIYNRLAVAGADCLCQQQSFTSLLCLMQCQTQALNIVRTNEHAALHYVSAHSEDPLCAHVWLADGIVVLLHTSGLQELLHVRGTLAPCVHVPVADVSADSPTIHCAVYRALWHCGHQRSVRSVA